MPSSAIRSFDYDAGAHRLDIRFVGGRLYSYFDVPERVFAAMLKAASKGGYFNRCIRDHYRFERRRGLSSPP